MIVHMDDFSDTCVRVIAAETGRVIEDVILYADSDIVGRGVRVVRVDLGLPLARPTAQLIKATKWRTSDMFTFEKINPDGSGSPVNADRIKELAGTGLQIEFSLKQERENVEGKGGVLGWWAKYTYPGDAEPTECRLLWIVPGIGLALCEGVDDRVFPVDDEGYLFVTS